VPSNELLEFLRHLLDPAAYQKAELLLKACTDTSTSDAESIRPPGSPEPLNGAMDSGYRYSLGSSDAFTKMRDLTAAQTETGVTMAMDAASCFRQALAGFGVNARDVHATALPEIYRAHTRQRRHAASGGGAPTMATDSRTTNDFDRRFPGIARIGMV
jgi:hypothetical protein